MADLTPAQLEAGMVALQTCRAQSRPDHFTVTMIHRAMAVFEAEVAVTPTTIEVQAIGTGGGPDDHPNPVMGNDFNELK